MKQIIPQKTPKLHFHELLCMKSSGVMRIHDNDFASGLFTSCSLTDEQRHSREKPHDDSARAF